MNNETYFGIKRGDIDWFPTIDYDLCTGCMACVQKCSHDVYSKENEMPKVSAPKNCVVGCTGCQFVCPEDAISHPPKESLRKFMEGDGREICRSCGCK